MLLLVMKEKHADFVFLEEKTYIFPKFESPALPSAGPGNSKKHRDVTRRVVDLLKICGLSQP